MNFDSLKILLSILSGQPPAGETLIKQDWEKMIAYAQWNRVAPLLYLRLSEENRLNSLPVHHARKLKFISRQASIRSLHFENECTEVIRILSSKGIRVIVIKGMALARLSYPSPSCKPMIDVDLLIEPQQIENAYALLKQYGRSVDFFSNKFREKIHQHFPPVLINGIPFELHRHITPSHVKSYIPVEELWKAPQDFKIGDAPCLMLQSEYFLFNLVDHLSRHLTSKHIRLIWLFDIVFYLKSNQNTIDWQRFHSILESTGNNRQILVTIALLNELLAINLPVEVAGSCMKDAKILASDLLALSSPYNASLNIGSFHAVRGLSLADKLNFFLSKLFPAKKYLKARFGLKSDFRAFFYYPVIHMNYLVKGFRVIMAKFEGTK